MKSPCRLSGNTLFILHISAVWYSPLSTFHMHSCILLRNEDDITLERNHFSLKFISDTNTQSHIQSCRDQLVSPTLPMNKPAMVNRSMILSPPLSTLLPPDDFAWDLFHFFQRVFGECLCAGCAALLRSAPAENLPPGLLLCGHWNGHQSAWGHTGRALTANQPCSITVYRQFSLWCFSTDKDLQQDHAPVHIQHVHGGVNCWPDLQPGCHRYQPAHVVLFPLSQPVGHASSGRELLNKVIGSTMDDSKATKSLGFNSWLSIRFQVLTAALPESLIMQKINYIWYDIQLT